MAKCRHCKQRRGKHLCPALEGSICSWCCAKQRRQKIDCPDGCEHLGPAQKKDTFQRVMDRLLVFARERDWGQVGVDAFLGPGREIREWEHECFVSYLCYGWEEGGDRLVDVFQRETSLSPAETKVVEALKQARFSLWEVQDVRLDKGIDYLDLLTGERLFVREKMATHQLSKLDLTLGWVIWMESGV